MNKEINIWWEGPFTQEEIVENKIDTENYDNTAEKVGLYQIYGIHPLYGTDVLLYIGRTKNNKGFANRLHKNRWETSYGSDNNNVNIYLGTIFTAAENKLETKEEYKQIEYAEVLLINAMKPAFNSSNIKSVGKKYIDMDYLINNLNSYKKIYPQLRSSYYWHDFLNIQIVDKLAKILSATIEDNNDFYGFDIKNNDNICFGIDYKIWNDENTPLVIGISRKAVEESVLNKETIFDCVSKDDDYYYLAITSDLKDEKIIENIENQLKAVENFLVSHAN